MRKLMGSIAAGALVLSGCGPSWSREPMDVTGNLGPRQQVEVWVHGTGPQRLMDVRWSKDSLYGMPYLAGLDGKSAKPVIVARSQVDFHPHRPVFCRHLKGGRNPVRQRGRHHRRRVRVHAMQRGRMRHPGRCLLVAVLATMPACFNCPDSDIEYRSAEASARIPVPNILHEHVVAVRASEYHYPGRSSSISASPAWSARHVPIVRLVEFGGQERLLLELPVGLPPDEAAAAVAVEVNDMAPVTGSFEGRRTADG